MLEVFRKFGSIQFDPIAVAGRNHDLVLHARVAAYEPAWCDALYERRRKVSVAVAHFKGYVPVRRDSNQLSNLFASEPWNAPVPRCG